uniref:ER membrane protein complex subunit 10 n=1 Tax=Ciona savignyi TaxID=51511 RepID=H2YXW3_CIOSA
MTGHINLLLLLFECFYFIICCHANANQDVGSGYLLTLQHSLDGDTFTKRGEIYFPNIKGSSAEVQNELPLSSADIELIKSVAEKNGFYRVRVSSSLQGVASNGDESWIMAFFFQKQLLEVNFSTKLNLLTNGAGDIVSMSIIPNHIGSDLKEENEFDTSVSVTIPGTAPVPDTHGYLNKMDAERRKKEISDKQPTSFFGKYWMYILPVVVFVMMSNAAQQQ